MQPKREPNAVAALQALIALAQEVVAGPHALLQMAESWLEGLARPEDHAQVMGLRYTGIKPLQRCDPSLSLPPGITPIQP